MQMHRAKAGSAPLPHLPHLLRLSSAGAALVATLVLIPRHWARGHLAHQELSSTDFATCETLWTLRSGYRIPGGTFQVRTLFASLRFFDGGPLIQARSLNTRGHADDMHTL